MDLWAKDAHGSTMLHFAVARGHLRAAEFLLLHHNVRPQRREERRQALLLEAAAIYTIHGSATEGTDRS